MPPNVNFFELENCLDTLVPFIERHPQKGYVKDFGPRARKAKDHLHQSFRDTDAVYTKWRLELGEGQLAMKHLQRACKKTQAHLEEVGAIGFPEDVVDYWDEGATVACAKAIIAWLKENEAALDKAAPMIAEIQTKLAAATGDVETGDQSLETYQRLSGGRKLAMEDAILAIDVLRRSIRDDLGIESPEYQAIRWPAMVAPDAF